MGVLNLPREIGFYNSGSVESPKGDSQGSTTVGVLNHPREIGVYNSGSVESPKGDSPKGALLQQWEC